MSEQSVIVWDLDTVPDLAAAARMLDMGNASEAEVREALGPGFPKHPLHKIACIGALIASRQPEGWRIDSLGAPHIGERPEAKLINDFIEKIGELRPQLITFNGHSFDLPVLRYDGEPNRLHQHDIDHGGLVDDEQVAIEWIVLTAPEAATSRVHFQ